MSKARKPAALIATLALAGCSSLAGVFGPDETIKVSEVGRAQNCAAQGPDTTAQVFGSADAVRAWQQGRGVELIGDQAMLPGTYVLVELGQRTSGGYGLVIGPDARLDGQRVRLQATFFAPEADAVSTDVMTSPCVLVRLPTGSWQGVDIYDQSGKRRARTASP